MSTYHEEKPTRTGPRSIGEGDQENTHTGTTIREGAADGGGAEKPVAYRKGQHRPPFKGGEVFGRLTVLSFISEHKGQQYWRCLCSCGKEHVTLRASLLSGKTGSCGCFRLEVTSRTQTTHGESRKGQNTPEYKCWCGIIMRCENPKATYYRHYGGRGIKMCSKWRDSYEAFLEDMGRRPSPKHSIERKRNDGDYEPENCCWATRKEQCKNQRSNVILTHDGITATQCEWAERTGIPRQSIYQRLKKGWSVTDTLTKPQRRSPNVNATRNTR